MKQHRIIYLGTILFIHASSFAQDTIIFTKQPPLLAKVTEVENTKVKYRKFDKLEGPVYSAPKSDIIAIRYNNGTRDIFNSTAPDSIQQKMSIEGLLKLLRTPNTPVFVIASDSASVIHARNALRYATSWNLVDDKSSSQFILRFSFVSIGMGDKKGKAQFLDPKTEEVILETNTVNTTFSWDVNTKRGVIDKIVNKEIKKLLKEQSE